MGKITWRLRCASVETASRAIQRQDRLLCTGVYSVNGHRGSCLLARVAGGLTRAGASSTIAMKSIM